MVTAPCSETTRAELQERGRIGLISREEAAPAENAMSLSGHAQQSVHLDNHLLDDRLRF